MVHDEAAICTVLSIAEVAQYLGISKTLAYDLAHRADFPSFKPKPGGRRILVRKSDLERWIEERKEQLI